MSGPVDAPEPYFDAYKPAQIAVLVEDVGVAKARLPLLQTVVLGLLAGANLAIVTFGDIIGGAGFVALVYWLVYLRGRRG